MMPPEEHILYTAVVARTFLDHGFTCAWARRRPKPRLDVVIRTPSIPGCIRGRAISPTARRSAPSAVLATPTRRT